AGDDWSVGDQRGLGDRQLYSRYQSAAHHHDLGRNRRSEDARGEPVGAARFRYGTAGDVPIGRLRGQDAWFFTYGHEGAGGFQLPFEAAGGKIVQKLWPPLNTPDYAPYLAQVKPDVDGIYMGFAGSNPLRFLKQFEDYGLKGKIAVLGNTTSTDEGILKL